MAEEAMEFSDEEQDMTVSESTFGLQAFLDSNVANERCVRYDPMVYTNDVAVDKILEYLDDDSLLKCTQVSRRWRQEVVRRNALWRRRCLGSVLHSYLVFIAHRNLHGMFRVSRVLLLQMASRECFTVEEGASSPVLCALHEEMASVEWRLQATTESENHVADIVKTPIKQQESFSCQERCVVCTEAGELIVVHEKEEKVLWRTNRFTTQYVHVFNNVIFAFTSTGNLEVHCNDEEDWVEVDAGGKLRDVLLVTLHWSGSRWYLRVFLKDNQIFLVNCRLEVFPLEIPLPKLSEYADVEPINEMVMVPNTLLEDGLIGLCIRRESTICFLVVTERGQILQHETWMYSYIHNWPFPYLHTRNCHYMVIEYKGQVEAISVLFKDRGLILERLWKKAIPANLSAAPHQVLVAGEKFLLTCLDGGLQVFRMDNGTMACEFPGFRTGPDVKVTVLQEGGLSAKDGITYIRDLAYSEVTYNLRNEGRNRLDTFYVINIRWLDGLSPDTTKSNHLVAAMFSKDYPGGKFLRWSPGLWEAIARSWRKLPSLLSSEEDPSCCEDELAVLDHEEYNGVP